MTCEQGKGLERLGGRRGERLVELVALPGRLATFTPASAGLAAEHPQHSLVHGH